MTTKLERAAMQQALEALELSFDHLFMSGFGRSIEKAITVLREALAEQAEQENVWKEKSCESCAFRAHTECRRFPANIENIGGFNHKYPTVRANQLRANGACAEWKSK